MARVTSASSEASSPCPDPLDLRAGMRDVGTQRLVLIDTRLWRSVTKIGADASLTEALYAGVGVSWCGIVVARVKYRGRAIADLIKGADKISEVGIICGEFRRDLSVHMMQVFWN